MSSFSTRVRREADGAIDYACYRRRALRLRQSRIRYMFHRRTFYPRMLYAGAIITGLIVGLVIPLAPAECRNCGTSIIDIPPGTEIDLLGETAALRHDMPPSPDRR